MKFKKIVKEGSEMHPEIKCDRCGFTSRQEDHFEINGDEILCDKCRRGVASEAMKKKKSRMHSNDVEKGWFGIKDAEFIYHGDWNDPEVEYKGVSLNYWDIESGLLEVYRDEHPEDKNDKGFDKWMADHPEEIKSELELLYDAEMEYRANNPEEQYDESWVGDKAKAGWNKVKSGAKAVKSGATKLAKAVGDAFKGPFRKGDHIMMKGEDGEQFKGTITGWDMDKKTYQVMLGNSVSEGSQEDALAMPNRIKEIEGQLQNNAQRLFNMLADEYLDNDKMFDELLEERDALVEELCGCRGLVKEETYEDKVHREWLDAVEKHKAERQAIKDRIRDIVGDEKADEVFEYWDKIQSSFNMRWKERDGFSGTDKEHLARLAEILGPKGKDIVDAIDEQFKRKSKELSDYYDTHSFTGD